MRLLKEELKTLMHSGTLDLASTQRNVSFPLIERMYKKMKLNVIFPTIRVHENAIIEGHHRYLASKLAYYSLEQSKGKRAQVKENVEWADVTLKDEDYYTPTKIKSLNEEDAKDLGMSVEELLEKMI